MVQAGHLWFEVGDTPAGRPPHLWDNPPTTYLVQVIVHGSELLPAFPIPALGRAYPSVLKDLLAVLADVLQQMFVSSEFGSRLAFLAEPAVPLTAVLADLLCLLPQGLLQFSLFDFLELIVPFALERFKPGIVGTR